MRQALEDKEHEELSYVEHVPSKSLSHFLRNFLQNILGFHGHEFSYRNYNKINDKQDPVTEEISSYSQKSSEDKSHSKHSSEKNPSSVQI